MSWHIESSTALLGGLTWVAAIIGLWCLSRPKPADPEPTRQLRSIVIEPKDDGEHFTVKYIRGRK